MLENVEYDSEILIHKAKAPLTDNGGSEWAQSVELRQSGVCRSVIEWVKHTATPGPRLQSRLAEQQKQRLSDSKVCTCLFSIYVATSA